MHGLNSYQGVAFLTPIERTNTIGSTLLASVWYHSPDSPNNINVIGAAGGFVGDDEIYLKRLYTNITMSNCGSHPCMLEAIWLRARNDVTSTVLQVMTQDYNGYDIPYVSPLAGHDLQKQFKILRKKKIVLKPGKPYKFACKSIYPRLNKSITRDVEGSDAYSHKKYNSILVFRAYGMPIAAHENGSTLNDTTLGPFSIRGIINSYASWTIMNDARPNTVALSSLGSVQPYDNRAHNPTLYNAVQASVPGYSDEAYPNHVFVSQFPV